MTRRSSGEPWRRGQHVSEHRPATACHAARLPGTPPLSVWESNVSFHSLRDPVWSTHTNFLSPYAQQFGGLQGREKRVVFLCVIHHLLITAKVGKKGQNGAPLQGASPQPSHLHTPRGLVPKPPAPCFWTGLPSPQPAERQPSKPGFGRIGGTERTALANTHISNPAWTLSSCVGH